MTYKSDKMYVFIYMLLFTPENTTTMYMYMEIEKLKGYACKKIYIVIILLLLK